MSPLQTDLWTLNMGPQHPSTHGVIRFVLRTDGEIIADADPDIGFLHRGLEKIAELIPYPAFMPYTDRLDYLAAINMNWAWALSVERLAGIEVPARAEHLRVITAELNRIASHLLSVGALASDMGAFTPFVHAIRDRERINDLFEELCGARLTFNYCRIGGVSLDAPPGWFDRVRGFLDYYEPMIDVFNRLITDNKIFVERLRRVAPVSAEMAIAYGLVGPNLRGSGVKFDLRKDEPYGIYPQLEFEVPVGRGYRDGVLGSCFDRYMVRIEELRQCIRIIRQCLDRIPEGEIQAKVPKVLRPAKGEVYCRTEAPRGEVGFYVISNGEKTPARVKIRTGSWSAMSIIRELSKGWMIADLVAIIGSLDVIAPEVDR